jgi:hypothetical protein
MLAGRVRASAAVMRPVAMALTRSPGMNESDSMVAAGIVLSSM